MLCHAQKRYCFIFWTFKNRAKPLSWGNEALFAQAPTRKLASLYGVCSPATVFFHSADQLSEQLRRQLNWTS